MKLVAMTHVSMAYGHLPLLDDASVEVAAGERLAIIGRNGTGKSTLLRILNGDLTPDHGSVWRAPTLASARLDQEVPGFADRPVVDVVAEGLGEIGDLVKAYHHAAARLAAGHTDAELAEFGRLQHALEERGGWTIEQRVELVLQRLDLPSERLVTELSGGWRRRVMLARALVAQPALLLLDEPTNHLDIDAITWLEALLADYDGAVVFVTHDRTFLRRLATRIIELDRGHLTSWPGDYDTFVTRKEAWLGAEVLQQEKFDKKLAQEEAWLRRGVKARRTRDEGRVKALMAMRQARAARRDVVGHVQLAIGAAERSGHVVFEAQQVNFGYDGRRIVRDFTARIVRGDRIGLVGPNGAGKTTLLRLLTGEAAPETGTIERGTNLEIAYYDQQREQLDPERTVAETVADGNDTVVVNGVPRHILGYLADFLFPPERARSPVKALSGGERNRLLLARLFTRPANVLILDEPTNDLDLETLELLESELVGFAGTILLVSHDRAFLDNVVTSIYAFEGDGRIREYVGGYEDWVRQRAPIATPSASPPTAPAAAKPRPDRAAPAKVKLSFKEQRELDELPGRIEALEHDLRALEAQLASPDFYRGPTAAVQAAADRLPELQQALDRAYARWHELESIAATAARGR